jgi:hypothetical protein
VKAVEKGEERQRRRLEARQQQPERTRCTAECPSTIARLLEQLGETCEREGRVGQRRRECGTASRLTKIAEDDMTASIKQTVLGFEITVAVTRVSFLSSTAQRDRNGTHR